MQLRQDEYKNIIRELARVIYGGEEYNHYLFRDMLWELGIYSHVTSF